MVGPLALLTVFQWSLTFHNSEGPWGGAGLGQVVGGNLKTTKMFQWILEKSLVSDE